MKRKLFTTAILFVMAVVFSIAYSAAPSATPTYGNYIGPYHDSTISSSTAFDTLSGVDSVTVFGSRVFDNFTTGWEWILVRDAITGGGTDSLFLQVLLDALDGSGNLLSRTVVDSFTAAAGESVSLPIGSTSIGTKYRCKLLGYGDNGGEVIINRLYLYKRRVVQKPLPANR